MSGATRTSLAVFNRNGDKPSLPPDLPISSLLSNVWISSIEIGMRHYVESTFFLLTGSVVAGLKTLANSPLIAFAASKTLANLLTKAWSELEASALLLFTSRTIFQILKLFQMLKFCHPFSFRLLYFEFDFLFEMLK